MSKRRNPNRVPEIADVLASRMVMTTSDFRRGVKINITSINGVRFDTPEQTTRIASQLSGIPLTPHRKRVSTIIKDQTRYKNPIFPTIKQTARVVSKTGKVYYRTFVTQDVELEHAFRSLQWQWNKTAKKGTSPRVRGKITSAKMVDYFRRTGRNNTLLYIKGMSAQISGFLPAKEENSLRIMTDVLDEIARNNPDMKNKVEDLERRLLNLQAHEHVDIYTLKDWRQFIYENNPDYDTILQHAEDEITAMEQMLKDDQKLIAKGKKPNHRVKISGRRPI